MSFHYTTTTTTTTTITTTTTTTTTALTPQRSHHLSPTHSRELDLRTRQPERTWCMWRKGGGFFHLSDVAFLPPPVHRFGLTSHFGTTP
jgi:hypothetical protein